MMFLKCFSFANFTSGSSQVGFLAFLYGNNKYAPIAWKSNKLKEELKVLYQLKHYFLKKHLLVV